MWLLSMQMYCDKRKCLHNKKSSTSTGLVCNSYMAALFWETNIENGTPCDMALYCWLALILISVLFFSSFTGSKIWRNIPSLVFCSYQHFPCVRRPSLCSYQSKDCFYSSISSITSFDSNSSVFHLLLGLDLKSPAQWRDSLLFLLFFFFWTGLTFLD